MAECTQYTCDADAVPGTDRCWLHRRPEIEPEVRNVMNSIARVIDDVLPEGWGFSFLVFRFGEDVKDSRMNYISNAPREDMLTAMKEFIAHSEGRLLAKPKSEQ